MTKLVISCPFCSNDEFMKLSQNSEGDRTILHCFRCNSRSKIIELEYNDMKMRDEELYS